MRACRLQLAPGHQVLLHPTIFVLLLALPPASFIVSGMDVTLHWLACLCLERNLLQPPTLAELRKVAKADADAVAYGELMLERGIIPDRELLQELLAEARERTRTQGDPPLNLFGGTDSGQPEVPAGVPGETVVNVQSGKPGLPDLSALKGGDERVFREAIISLLQYATASGASDLHLSAGARPFVRRDRENHYLGSEPLSAQVVEGLNRALLSEHQWTAFQRNRDFDFALPFSSGERYRVNLMIHKEGCAGSYRTVPRELRSLEELGFRNARTIDRLLSFHNGLIMVTGPVGSGKTTTLGALVQQLNRTRDDHLISVEEPIEFVHQPDRCIVTQRGVGQHTENFHSALKGALRQDPDIIVIGEMRDLETIEMAISASETGHLVIGTMHTSDAATTLNRLLDVFPPAQQSQIRAMVAESLRGIICQRLLPAKEGGLALATEILIRNTAVSALIREGKTQGLGNIMETGKAEGMIAMDSSVVDLWREGKISDETALANLRSEIAGREIRATAPASVPAPAASPEPAASLEPAPKKRSFFNLKR